MHNFSQLEIVRANISNGAFGLIHGRAWLQTLPNPSKLPSGLWALDCFSEVCPHVLSVRKSLSFIYSNFLRINCSKSSHVHCFFSIHWCQRWRWWNLLPPSLFGKVKTGLTWVGPLTTKSVLNLTESDTTEGQSTWYIFWPSTGSHESVDGEDGS